MNHRFHFAKKDANLKSRRDFFMRHLLTLFALSTTKEQLKEFFSRKRKKNVAKNRKKKTTEEEVKILLFSLVTK